MKLKNDLFNIGNARYIKDINEYIQIVVEESSPKQEKIITQFNDSSILNDLNYESSGEDNVLNYDSSDDNDEKFQEQKEIFNKMQYLLADTKSNLNFLPQTWKFRNDDNLKQIIQFLTYYKKKYFKE